MIVRSKNPTPSRYEQFTADIIAAIMIALVAIALLGPIFASTAYAGESLRHTECSSQTTQNATMTMPDFGSGTGSEWIDTLGHNDNCQH